MSTFEVKLFALCDTLLQCIPNKRAKFKEQFNDADYDYIAECFYEDVSPLEKLLTSKNKQFVNDVNIRLFRILPIGQIMARVKLNDRQIGRIWEHLQVLYIISKSVVEKKNSEKVVSFEEEEQENIRVKDLSEYEEVKLPVDFGDIMSKLSECNYYEKYITVGSSKLTFGISGSLRERIIDGIWDCFVLPDACLSKKMFSRLFNQLQIENEGERIFKVEFNNIDIPDEYPDWFNDKMLEYRGIIFYIVDEMPLDIITLEE
jgi:hypothetical protein